MWRWVVPSSLRDELVSGRVFQAPCAWLISVFASRLSLIKAEKRFGRRDFTASQPGYTTSASIFTGSGRVFTGSRPAFPAYERVFPGSSRVFPHLPASFFFRGP